jgi:hypothetical protein
VSTMKFSARSIISMLAAVAESSSTRRTRMQPSAFRCRGPSFIALRSPGLIILTSLG